MTGMVVGAAICRAVMRPLRRARQTRLGGTKHAGSELKPKFISDQMIRENPASRGTETSAEVLVGPPWRMESSAGQQQWYYIG